MSDVQSNASSKKDLHVDICSFGHIGQGLFTATINGLVFIDIYHIHECGYNCDLYCWVVVDFTAQDQENTITIYSAYKGDPPPSNEYVYLKTIQSQVDDTVYDLYVKWNRAIYGTDKPQPKNNHAKP